MRKVEVERPSRRRRPRLRVLHMSDCTARHRHGSDDDRTVFRSD